MLTRVVLIVLLSPFATWAQQQQTRPRRVLPAEPATDAASPALRGNNPSRQSKRGSAQSAPKAADKDAGEPQTGMPALPTGEEVSEGDTLRIDTTLVTVPVSVLDRDGKYVPNLRKGDFRLWEDNVEQQIAYFASVDAPFIVALLLDTSGSMQQKWDDIQEAAINFTRRLRPEDRVMVISFDDTVRVLAEPTNDRYILRQAIRQARGGEGTRLYDAVDLVIHRYLANVDGRKAVVLFTDGVDTTSRWATYETTAHAAEEADLLIYPVEYDTYDDARQMAQAWPSQPIIVLGFPFPAPPSRPAGTRRSDYEVGDNYLHDLARATGARFYAADDPQKLDVAFQAIAEELGRQYGLGYYPMRKPKRGERRQVKVRVNRPNVVVRARESYAF